ncbi:hypothetical protein G6F22_015865 [Rhizopus arrhizus]|nr:hypothetical protein G6F22_015865 [Rhizopus arrhizus]
MLIPASTGIKIGQGRLGSDRFGHRRVALLHVVVADLERPVHLRLAPARAGVDVLDPARVGLDAAVCFRIKRVEAADVGVELCGQLLLCVGACGTCVRLAGRTSVTRGCRRLATAGAQD